MSRCMVFTASHVILEGGVVEISEIKIGMVLDVSRMDWIKKANSGLSIMVLGIFGKKRNN